MTYAGFDSMTSHDAGVVLSDDSAPASKSDFSINPSGGKAVELNEADASDISRPGLKYWMGERRSEEWSSEMLVRRVGITAPDGRLLVVERLDEPVRSEGTAVLQVAIGMRLVNVQQPRYRFQT